MAKNLNRPVFIIGCGRSGTTIFFRLLAGHKDLAWFSNYLRWYPEALKMATLNRLFHMPILVKLFEGSKWFPKPVESERLWDRFHPLDNPSGTPALSEDNAHEMNLAGIQSYIASIMHYSGCERFVIKETRFARRIRYLLALFPDACFIHIIRDGRAVTSSLLRVDWWPSLPVWWADGKTPLQLQQTGLNSVQIAARMWKAEVERILADKEYIPRNQYTEIRYESLMRDPFSEIKQILHFCELPVYPGFDEHINALKLEPKNYKWMKSFTPVEIASIEKEIGPLLSHFGYS